MNLLREYINYVRRSESKYGIHSPFVFDFVANGMTAQLENTTKQKLKKIIRSYQKNHKQIEINDLGAGSKKLGKLRKISDIAHTSASKGVFSLLLFQCAKHWQCKNCLELGTSLGLRSMYLSSASPEVSVTTVDACANTQQIARETALKAGFDQIQFVHSDFESFLSQQPPVVQDLIFVDGHHDGKALLHYMNLLEPWSGPDTIFILDDIRWSDDMLAAWKHLCADERFHVSLDFFRMGILVQRPQQAREHFVIRIRSVLRSMI